MGVRIRDNQPKHQVTCRNCGVELEYDASDTKEWSRRDYLGDVSTGRAIECPNCKQDVVVRIP